MLFFNIDCHVSVISDIKNIFTELGHKVYNWSLSGHNWIFNFSECNSPVGNSNTARNAASDSKIGKL
jgi:hypothetical protein